MGWTLSHRIASPGRIYLADASLGAGLRFCRFPSLNFGQFPTGAAGGQLDRTREGRVFPNPAARGQMVNAKAFADLAIRQIDFGHWYLLALLSKEIGAFAFV